MIEFEAAKKRRVRDAARLYATFIAGKPLSEREIWLTYSENRLRKMWRAPDGAADLDVERSEQMVLLTMQRVRELLAIIDASGGAQGGTA